MITRRILLPLVTVLALTGLCAAGSAQAVPLGDNAAAIRHVMMDQQAAWNRGDVEAFMHGYQDSPDTTFVGAGVRKGYRGILASYRKHYATRAQMGTLTFSDLDVRLLPAADGAVRYAAVTGHFHLQRSVRGEAPKDDGVFSLLWQKTREGWKIILDHSS